MPSPSVPRPIDDGETPVKRIPAFAVLLLTSCSGAAPDRLQTVDPAFLMPGDLRTFSVEYSARVAGIPAGTRKLRVWIPVPRDSNVQEIRGLSFSREPRLGTEPKYGNRIACWEVENPGASFEATMRFVCSRLEVRTDLDSLKAEGKDPEGAFEVFRKPDALVTVDDDIRRLAEEVVRGRTGAVEQARAIYDDVLSKMTYDKTAPGWGSGSTRRACEVGQGNCTDFHALFNSLCRARGIASGFEIGLYLPYERRKEEKPGGYHGWAFFRVPGRTWVPVDCSEASRFPGRAEYVFGGLTSDRATLSTGRDLVLDPPQEGPPLNYLLDPYAEADGKPVQASKAWSWRDLD
jgi:transglutaminase-like putative cysteine protease